MLLRTSAAIFLLTSPAAACDAPVTLSEAQVRGALGELSDEAVEGYSKFLAFQVLSCSDQPVVRQLGQEAALASSEASLQAAVLFEVIMARESLIIRPMDNEAMTEEERAYALANPVVALRLTFWDRERSCISLSRNSVSECPRDFLIDVRGNGVSIIHDDASAELTINNAGDLAGFYFPEKTSFQIPVTAELF